MAKKVSNPKMPDLSLVAKAAAREQKETLDVVTGCRSLVIENADDYRAGADIVATIKARFEKIDALRRSWVDPLNGVVRSINNFFKPITDGLEESEHIVKGKLALYIDEKGAEHDHFVAEASTAAKSGAAAQAERALERAAECIIPKVDGLAVREEWTGAVVDPSLIPREFMVPDVKALLAVTRARKGETNIPGWKIEKKRNLAVKAGDE